MSFDLRRVFQDPSAAGGPRYGIIGEAELVACVDDDYVDCRDVDPDDDADDAIPDCIEECEDDLGGVYVDHAEDACEDACAGDDACEDECDQDTVCAYIGTETRVLRSCTTSNCVIAALEGSAQDVAWCLED